MLHPLEQVTGLAVEHPAHGLQGAEPHGLGPTVPEDRDVAADRGYRPIIVSDACVGIDDALHDLSCAVMRRFARVVDVSEALKLFALTPG